MTETERERIYYAAINAALSAYEADRAIAMSLMTAARNLRRLARKTRETVMDEAFRVYRESQQSDPQENAQ